MKTQLLLVISAALLCSGARAEQSPRLLWGDTHIHTSFSSDAFANYNRDAGPDAAYRYARGLPAVHPFHRAKVTIDTPLDFLVVSDHAEYLGVMRHVYFDGADTSEVGLVDSAKAKIAQWIFQWAMDSDAGQDMFAKILPPPRDPREAAAEAYEAQVLQIAWFPPMQQVQVDAWRSITDAADHYNEPGEFSAIIGWEWTSIPGGANLHRVIMSDLDAATAQGFQPLGNNLTPYPEDLWAWLEKTSAETGADFLSIPHNSNISKGFMFDTNTLRGEEFTPEYLKLRAKWEQAVEITQIKGDSEAHPNLSPDDEFADFEEYPFYIEKNPLPYDPKPGDYIRSALLRGLELEREHGINPYQFGVLGSTDAHTAFASAEENNFHGKIANSSIPEVMGNTLGGDEDNTFGWAMSASGLAAVWAEDNTREAILSAMKRREVYGTSGPRIGVRFFGGWGFSGEALNDPDIYNTATASGVPMGGELRPPNNNIEAPSFIVMASKDPVGANLDRIQVIKGWIDTSGKTHEKVFDLAWSGDRTPGENGKVPAVGNTVDIATASYENSIGAVDLQVVWQDPEFDPAVPAFYYARVLEIPTPRHSLYDKVALGGDVDTRRPDSLQERAYTSAIWYRP